MACSAARATAGSGSRVDGSSACSASGPPTIPSTWTIRPRVRHVGIGERRHERLHVDAAELDEVGHHLLGEAIVADRLDQLGQPAAAVAGEREGAGEPGPAILLAAGAGLDGPDRGDVAEARQALEGGATQVRVPRA